MRKDVVWPEAVRWVPRQTSPKQGVLGLCSLKRYMQRRTACPAPTAGRGNACMPSLIDRLTEYLAQANSGGKGTIQARR